MLALLLTLTALAVTPGQGFEIPANEGWVTDRAGLLNPGEESALEALMESYRVGSQEEVALLTVPALGGRTIEEFALAVARAWKIGDQQTSAGALLVVAQAEHELRIEVGRGLEGKLTDSIAGRIIRDVIVPEFKAQRFYPGIRDGIVAIHAALGGNYGVLERGRGQQESGKAIASAFVLLLVVLVFARLKRRSGLYGSRGSGALPWLLASQIGHHGSGRVGGFSGGSLRRLRWWRRLFRRRRIGAVVMAALALFALLQGWAARHADGAGQGWLGTLGLLALLGAYGGLLARALWRRRWYRATGVLSAEDLRGLHAELAAAEKHTVGEILTVVLERSDRHPGACWLAALTCTLIGTLGASAWLPWDQPALVLAAELALGALGYATARWLPDFQHFFMGVTQTRAAAEEQAFQEFHRYELFRTEGRTGVLLFVSLLERHAIVLADVGIAERVEPEHWLRTHELMLAGIRRGSLRAGLVAGIQSAGEVLAQHFPVAGEARNEVPDRVIVRRE